MGNKLFIICPFSGLEIALQNDFGSDIYFLTYTGSVIQLDEAQHLQAVADFIRSANISSIYIVNDTSCRFINCIIADKTDHTCSASLTLEHIYHQHYTSLFKGSSYVNKVFKLIELNLRHQAEQLKQHPVAGAILAQNKVSLKGLLYSKEQSIIRTFDLN